jgi:hypothetical protein
LLDRLQNGSHRGKGVAEDQSTHGRMGLGTVCKEETSRMKNVSIENWRKRVGFGLRETVCSQKHFFNNIKHIFNGVRIMKLIQI